MSMNIYLFEADWWPYISVLLFADDCSEADLRWTVAGYFKSLVGCHCRFVALNCWI